MQNTKFLHFMRRRVASTAVGASTVRGLVNKGGISKIREFFETVPLSSISKAKEAGAFESVLDNETERFLSCLRCRQISWGACRKLLNIYLRDATYNAFLREHYGLKRIEKYLEVPIDSHVAHGLSQEREGRTLPKWKTIKGLHEQEHAAFQLVAKEVANRKGMDRVHLDLIYWRHPQRVHG